MWASGCAFSFPFGRGKLRRPSASGATMHTSPRGERWQRTPGPSMHVTCRRMACAAMATPDRDRCPAERRTFCERLGLSLAYRSDRNGTNYYKTDSVTCGLQPRATSVALGPRSGLCLMSCFAVALARPGSRSAIAVVRSAIPRPSAVRYWRCDGRHCWGRTSS